MAISTSWIHVLPQTISPKCSPLSLNILFNHSSPRLSKLRLNTSIRCSSSDSRSSNSQISDDHPFACPICYEPLIRTSGPPGFNLSAINGSGFKCCKCNKTFSGKDKYLDLTTTAGMEYLEVGSYGSELYRYPLFSFLYRRGWRQNVTHFGFPGPDEEFKMAQEYLKSAGVGILLDVSCGPGLFTHKFAKSGTYSKVIALDFSENMLHQCDKIISKDPSILTRNLALVRADVSRLPFPSGSIDAIHAGAVNAIQCWLSPPNAIAEISRVLRSGGVFVGTSFLKTKMLSDVPQTMLQDMSCLKEKEIENLCLQTMLQDMSYLTEMEIEDLCTSMGLTNFTIEVHQAFIMFSAQKP